MARARTGSAREARPRAFCCGRPDRRNRECERARARDGQHAGLPPIRGAFDRGLVALSALVRPWTGARSGKTVSSSSHFESFFVTVPAARSRSCPAMTLRIMRYPRNLDVVRNESEVMNAQSKRWLAVVLSLLTAGLGHVYAGRPVRALALAVSIEVLAVLAAALAATAPARIVSLGVAAAPLVVVLIALDAARIASRPRTRFLTRRAVVLACGGFLVASTAVGFGGDWARQRWGARPLVRRGVQTLKKLLNRGPKTDAANDRGKPHMWRRCGGGPKSPL